MVNRREFIKGGCSVCLGLVTTSVFLESCAAGFPLVKAPKEGDALRVATSNFQTPLDILIVRNKSLECDILLRKEGEDYLALYLKCTHEGIGLTTTKERIYCTAHGSAFDLNGNVLKAPARRPLTKFRTSVENNDILIYLT